MAISRDSALGNPLPYWSRPSGPRGLPRAEVGHRLRKLARRNRPPRLRRRHALVGGRGPVAHVEHSRGARPMSRIARVQRAGASRVSGARVARTKPGSPEGQRYARVQCILCANGSAEDGVSATSLRPHGSGYHREGVLVDGSLEGRSRVASHSEANRQPLTRPGRGGLESASLSRMAGPGRVGACVEKEDIAWE